jgi:hypothetical protein
MPFQIVLKAQNDKNKLITRCTSITPHDQYNAKGLGIDADTRYSPAPFLKIFVILFIQKPELLTWYPRLDIQYLIPVQFDYEWPL